MGSTWWNVSHSQKSIQDRFERIIVFVRALFVVVVVAKFHSLFLRSTLVSLCLFNSRMAAYFFSVAFLCFMAVAGIPAFLEDRSVTFRIRCIVFKDDEEKKQI
jgi:hypothetical protein